MSKKDSISELTNLLAIALRHKIGSIVNENEIYVRNENCILKDAVISFYIAFSFLIILKTSACHKPAPLGAGSTLFF